MALIWDAIALIMTSLLWFLKVNSGSLEHSHICLNVMISETTLTNGKSMTWITRSWCYKHPWWRHQMERFSRYWLFVRGIHRSPVNSPHKGQWRGALIFFYLHLNKRLSKHLWSRWFETPSRSLWRHCNDHKTKHNNTVFVIHRMHSACTLNVTSFLLPLSPVALVDATMRHGLFLLFYKHVDWQLRNQ